MTRAEVYRRLAELYNYTPSQIADMTPYAQLVLLTKITGKGTMRFSNAKEYQAYLAGTRAKGK